MMSSSSTLASSSCICACPQHNTMKGGTALGARQPQLQGCLLQPSVSLWLMLCGCEHDHMYIQCMHCCICGWYGSQLAAAKPATCCKTQAFLGFVILCDHVAHQCIGWQCCRRASSIPATCCEMQDIFGNEPLMTMMHPITLL